MLGKLHLWPLIAALAVAFAARADVAPPPADPVANKELVMEAFQRLFVERKLFDEAEKYIARDLVEHNPNAGNGTEALKAYFKDLWQRFPDFTIEAKRAVAEGDLVLVHFHARNDAKDRGMAGVDIFRVVDGLIVEHWDVLQPVPETSANNNTMF